MEHTHTIGAILFTVTQNGTLDYCISRNAAEECTLDAQETLDFIIWLQSHQNYFALSKVHEDQRRAMLAEIASAPKDSK